MNNKGIIELFPSPVIFIIFTMVLLFILSSIMMIIIDILLILKKQKVRKLKDLNKIYRKNYKIDFKNEKIFELINFDNKQTFIIEEDETFLPRTIKHFKTRFEKDITLREIEKRIFYNNYNYSKNKKNKKIF